jgi:hypothetical protein
MKKLLSITFFLCLTNLLHTQCGIGCWDKVYLQGGTFYCVQDTLVFEDEFTGNTLNTNVWQTHFFGANYVNARTHGPCEEQFYFDQNVSVSNGACILTGLWEPNTTFTNSANQTFTRHFTSGMIMYRDDLEPFNFGRYEASIRIPGTGWWPAFWLWSFDEIDILENFWNDNTYQSNVHSGPSLCEKTLTEYNAPLLDSNWHRFAVEWTPFSISFFYNDILQLPVIYRFYRSDGTPLIVNCDIPLIPEGEYYVNPKTIESNFRTFRPILNNAVLPKNGNNCFCEFGTDCSEPDCGNFGNPIDSNCNIIGDIPAEMFIDWVKVRQYEYEACGSILVFGDNCTNTGNNWNPRECAPLCPNQVSRLFIENYSSSEWIKEVTITSVTSSSNILILSNSNSQIEYRLLDDNIGIITINYLSDCNQAHSYTVELTPESQDFFKNFSLHIIDECDYSMDIRRINDYLVCPLNSMTLNVTIHNNLGEQITVLPSITGDFIHISWLGFDGVNRVVLNYSYQSACYGTVSGSVEFDIPSCCCPVGFSYDQANCHSGYYFAGVNGFVLDNKFYTTKNCELYPTNDCCPPSTTSDGENCLYGFIDVGFEGFVYDSAFYTFINCEKNCCPNGFEYDGANCHSDFYFSGVSGLIIDNKFYTTQNCQKYSENNCCPPGTTAEGTKCYFATIPLGFEGFVYDSSFFLTPNCITCCPKEAEFDGENCYYGIHFEEGEGFIYNNSFYTIPNCFRYRENNCCPPSSVFDGAHCYYGIHFEEGEGFIYNNSFYTTPLDCYEEFNSGPSNPFSKKEDPNVAESRSVSKTVFESIKVYPSPFSDEFFIHIGDQFKQIEKIEVYNANGIRSQVFNKGNIRDLLIVENINVSGVYFVNVISKNESKIYKLININK